MPQQIKTVSRLTHLGGLPIKDFLQHDWGKKPRLIRNTFKDFSLPIDKATLFELASNDDAQSRLIRRESGVWQLEHGPFEPTYFNKKWAKLAKQHGNPWTVLVQDTNHFVSGADALLSQFSFVPYARLDDLMVSYATDGGGVGAHVDSYDVFLLQAYGKRRWQWGRQKDLSFVEDAPLKLLKRFRPEFDEVLEPGDMLYLPAGWAHNGVAVGECVTYSIGFRAPTIDEIRAQLLNALEDTEMVTPPYSDGDASRFVKGGAGEIPTALRDYVHDAIARIIATPVALDAFVGRLLTEPKSNVFFTPPERELSLNAFEKRAVKNGVRLDAKARLIYDAQFFYMNGEMLDLRGAKPKDGVSTRLRRLADDRMLPANSVDARIVELLYPHYCAGELHAT